MEIINKVVINKKYPCQNTVINDFYKGVGYNKDSILANKIISFLRSQNMSVDTFRIKLKLSETGLRSWLVSGVKPKNSSLCKLEDATGIDTNYWADDSIPVEDISKWQKTENQPGFTQIDNEIKYSPIHRDYYQDVFIGGRSMHIWGKTPDDVKGLVNAEIARFESILKGQNAMSFVINENCSYTTLSDDLEVLMQTGCILETLLDSRKKTENINPTFIHNGLILIDHLVGLIADSVEAKAKLFGYDSTKELEIDLDDMLKTELKEWRSKNGNN